MTAQEIFTKVRDHLLTQNAKAGYPDPYCDNGFACRYRDVHGRACAVGVLIPNGHPAANPDCDKQVRTLIREYYPDLREHCLATDLPETWGTAEVGSGSLLRRLQQIHDELPVECWENALRSMAVDFGLEY